MPERIDRFTGLWEFLSNFFPAPVAYEGILYPTTEHAFNAAKTLNQLERERIAAADSPSKAKAMGRTVRLRPDWDTRVRYEVMEHVLELKFAPGTHLATLLVNTDPAELVEGNNWHDTHWGVCTCPRHAGAGDNHLGRLLMQLRAQLCEEAW